MKKAFDSLSLQTSLFLIHLSNFPHLLLHNQQSLFILLLTSSHHLSFLPFILHGQSLPHLFLHLLLLLIASLVPPSLIYLLPSLLPSRHLSVSDGCSGCLCALPIRGNGFSVYLSIHLSAEPSVCLHPVTRDDTGNYLLISVQSEPDTHTHTHTLLSSNFV